LVADDGVNGVIVKEDLEYESYNCRRDIVGAKTLRMELTGDGTPFVRG
jgi:hypothetical protein